MAILFTRTAIVPVWLLASALVIVMTAPSGLAAAGLLLLISGLAAAAFVLLRERPADLPVLERPAATATRRISWPNSGFRNIGRGTKGG